jgi:hypothetical protein
MIGVSRTFTGTNQVESRRPQQHGVCVGEEGRAVTAETVRDKVSHSSLLIAMVDTPCAGRWPWKGIGDAQMNLSTHANFKVVSVRLRGKAKDIRARTASEQFPTVGIDGSLFRIVCALT